ncbi:MAG TPA: cobalamin-dependent protein [Streptosporangiaceae bacterium]|jgi:methylaspartate mutase sigma subunit
MPDFPRTVIIGVAESDAHAVANQLIAMQLRRSGFVVVNLGVCTPLVEFAEALRTNPDAEAIIIGSLNGHALEDLACLPELRAAGAITCPVILGGNLSVGSVKDAATAGRLRRLGVDHVLGDLDELAPLLNTLRTAHEAVRSTH